MTSKIHWINADGVERIEMTTESPSFNKMKDFLGDNSEHVSVLFNGKPTSMFVHEFGRTVFDDRNPTATEIYFAASRARGIDPEDKSQERKGAEATAKRLGIPFENITYLDPAPEKPVGIYGPAILLEGFKLE
jgi:hypothetical protein